METTQSPRDAFVFSMNLVGGALCFDFTNTVDGRGGNDTNVTDYLHDYSDLVGWGQHTCALTDEEAARLYAAAARHPDEAAQVFRRAIDLRETLYRIFAAIAHHRDSEPIDLATLNRVLSEAMLHAHIRQSPQGFSWDWQDVAPTALEHVLWPVARSAAEVLTSEARQRVRECPGARCSWLFVDTSKNHRRRWCNMDSCGNRAKARRHYTRKRSSDSPAL
ncbi:MAG: CGNR zinc finger domain-containing protein [Ktedonobacterales bacterium]